MLTKLNKLFRALRTHLLDTYSTRSYSQEGEDMILRRIFNDKGEGFYVDVGAHHPQRFSNTNYFYQHGWFGINIEPNPEVADAFARDRQRDINLQMGIAEREGMLTYSFFNDPALNTFDSDLAASRERETNYRVIGTKEIPVRRLDAVLTEYMPPERRQIDFMSVDVEGLDMAVLRSNDWEKFRPTHVLAESLDTSLEKAMQGEMVSYMKARGYELFAKTHNTLIFRDVRAAGEA